MHLCNLRFLFSRIVPKCFSKGVVVNLKLCDLKEREEKMNQTHSSQMEK